MSAVISRRRALVLMSAAAGFASAGAELAGQTQQATRTRIDVYKDPSCGCCSKWVDHLKANGFDARVIDGDTRAIKAKHGVTTELASCHTGIVNGYVIEGHVPAADIRTLLAKKPAGVVGLTIPGMPQSAPGMDVTPFQPYTVLSFNRQGRTATFARYTTRNP
jgi:hypothetical protein